MTAGFAREEALFSAVIAFAPEERDAWLRRACAEDADLRLRVESLLDGFDAAASFMDGVTVGVSDLHMTLAVDGADRDTEVLGSYRLLRLLGEGGSSLVYLAEQLAPLRREVAVKVIKLGMDTKAVLARFQAERQALALMEHPNIAMVFDAGAAPNGRPYFVMERVQGIRITDYCDHVHLTTPERVELFVQVCHAIQHAHERGVIHRDIKPANILVTLHDGVAVAKVIDFGIAKALQGRLTDQTLFTAFEQFIGTPAYVSPEQTDPLAAHVDVRSDIYSLGVLLYELLTGCTPFDNAELISAGLEEMRLRIREEDPPTPSRRLGRVHGDLDWIVMRCLEKEPERRYPSVRELALDLTRHLCHEPVLARPPSTLYLMRKFARRNQALCIAVSAIIAVLSVATAVSLWLAVRASDAEARALAASQSASMASAERQQVIDFLKDDLLAQAVPGSDTDPDMKLRTAVDRAAQNVDQRFRDQPLVAATVHETLASTYESLGQHPAAQHHFEAAHAIFKAHLGEHDARTLTMVNGIVFALDARGQPADAEALAVKTLALERATLGTAHQVTLQTMAYLAEAYVSQSKFKQAEALQLEALATRTRVLGPEHPLTLGLMTSLGETYGKEGRYAESEAIRTRALEIQTRVLGREHVNTIMTTNDLAVTYQMQRNNAKARELLADVVPRMQRVFGPHHEYTVVAITNLASLYTAEGRLAEAEPIALEAVALMTQIYGPEHPMTIAATNNLSLTYRLEGKFAKAISLQQKTLEVAVRVLGSEHYTTLMLLSNIARTYADAGHLRRADAGFASALEKQKRVLGANHPETLETARDYGTLLITAHKYVQAEAVLRDVIARREALASPGWQLHSARSALGEALAKQGQLTQAEPLLISGYDGLQEARRAQTAPLSPRVAREITAGRMRLEAFRAAAGTPERATRLQQAL